MVMLRPKCYAIRNEDGHEIKRSKSLQRSVVNNEIDNYLDTCTNNKDFFHELRVFKTKKPLHHNIFLT